MVQINPISKGQNVYDSPQLRRVETFVAELSLVEQLWLMEWLAQHIREAAITTSRAKYDVLAEMANDSDIQRETREINSEFLAAEADGLDQYQ